MRAAGWLLLVALAQEKEKPVAFEARGRLVCLLEEMKDKYRAEVPAAHEHLAGFRAPAGPPGGGFRYYVLLRNSFSEVLFVDARFKEHELRLGGRVFPSTSILEVSRFQWYRDGKLMDVSFWCPVCAIKGADPGPCFCCQGKVELREDPAGDAGK